MEPYRTIQSLLGTADEPRVLAFGLFPTKLVVAARVLKTGHHRVVESCLLDGLGKGKVIPLRGHEGQRLA